MVIVPVFVSKIKPPNTFQSTSPITVLKLFLFQIDEKFSSSMWLSPSHPLSLFPLFLRFLWSLLYPPSFFVSPTSSLLIPFRGQEEIFHLPLHSNLPIPFSKLDIFSLFNKLGKVVDSYIPLDKLGKVVASMVAAPWPSTLVGDPTKARNSLCEWQNPQEHLLILHCLPKLLSLVLGRLSLRILHLLKSWQLRSVLLPLTKENQSSLVKLLLTRELIFEPLSSSCSTIILG